MFRLKKFGIVVGGLALAASAPAADQYQAQLRNGFSIRHQHREVIAGVTRLYLSAGAESYVEVPTAEIVGLEREPGLPAPGAATAPAAKPAGGDPIDAVVEQAGERHGVDPDLIRSVIRAESGFRSRAVSRRGARGLMQLMPSTALRLGVNDAFDPAANVDAGAGYLRQLLGLYHDDMIKALAAYNAGPQRVAQYRGVPPFRETRAYVARIVREFNCKKQGTAEGQPGRRKRAAVPGPGKTA